MNPPENRTSIGEKSCQQSCIVPNTGSILAKSMALSAKQKQAEETGGLLRT
jgi:hypothetical protein